jgi:hypothetical protein
MLILPSMVSIVRFVPRMAYVKVMGISDIMLSPSIEKVSCSFILRFNKRSPGGELKQSEACPRLGRRIFW